jgi:hypothetical protein
LRRSRIAIRKSKALALGLAGIFILAVLVYAVFVRSWMLSWGATAAEKVRPLPGDELVPSPSYQSTRALSIAAPAEEVWAWLVQLGQNRGGFYSYSCLENLAFADIHNTNHILPEWQKVQPGDFISMTPRDWPLGLVRRAAPVIGVRVERLEPARYLVLGGWGSFVLQPLGGKKTRFIVRRRSAPMNAPAKILLSLFFDPLHFVMERRMMKGIRIRAEGGVEATSLGESLGTAGFVLAALLSAVLVVSRRRKWPWLAVPFIYALTIVFSTSDFKAALAGFTAISLIAAGCLFLRRWRWAYLLAMFIYAHAVLFLARDAYVVFGLVFLLAVPYLSFRMFSQKIIHLTQC